jgi:hypothetical protein
LTKNLTNECVHRTEKKNSSIIKNDDVGYSSVSRRAGRARGRAERQGVHIQHTRRSSGGTAGAAATGGPGTAASQARREASGTTRAELSQGSSSYLCNKRGEHRNQASIRQDLQTNQTQRVIEAIRLLAAQSAPARSPIESPQPI